ncbi:hypothetical protein DM860_009863 [Cuscuta australis]|uniref:F-box domain-containing protein n=1 Tax=Cuscuta australis TaxID=267555 RepID=A0A328DFS2_9ASTE|nr:hypothetical protein DM860_009863 [Cuscuta australis]
MDLAGDGLFDYLTALPESVIHHILSFLPFKHVARCCVLSKQWYRIWLNYPNIDLLLDEELYMNGPDIVPYLEYFDGIMDQCLFRKACVQNLKLCLHGHSNLKEVATKMDRWLGGAITRNVSLLAIVSYQRQDHSRGPKYLFSIPGEVAVAHSLKVLDLTWCVFEDRFTCFELPHLLTLKLYSCRLLGENVLHKILCGCPELEHVEFTYCKGVGSFLSVSRKPRLKYVKVSHLGELERIEMFSLSLETFIYAQSNPCSIDLASCIALKHLELHAAILSADYIPIQYLLSKLVYIEELQLHSCKAAGKVRISSSCLKKLIVTGFNTFLGVEIDIPNLMGLELMGFGAHNSDNQFGNWNVPMVEEIEITFSAERFWTFCKAGLQGFLMKLHNYEKLNLLIKSRSGHNFILHEKLHAVTFSSLDKLLKEAKPQHIVASSRIDETLLKRTLLVGVPRVVISLIFTSRQSMELLYKKLKKAVSVQKWFGVCQLVSTEEIEHDMDPVWKSFMKTHSTGCHTATIIIHMAGEEMGRTP